jgi:hypothetical protein
MPDSEAWTPNRPSDERPSPPPAAPSDEQPPANVDEVEVVDGLPVLSEVREVVPVRVGAIPAVQAAAAAATGFVAGAATMALARRFAVRRVARVGGSGLLPGSGRRTYVVHVRVLGRPGE